NRSLGRLDMNNVHRHVGLRVSICVASLSIAVALIGSGGSRASGQDNLVRVVSPADLVLKPIDVGKSTTQVEVEYDPRIARVEFETTLLEKFTVVATNKRFTFSVCGSGVPDAPGYRLHLGYEAFDAAGKSLGLGTLYLTLGPDTTKPEVRIVSPKNGAMVGPGETVDIVVAGEESRSAPTWQAGVRRLTLVDPTENVQTSPETDKAQGCDAKSWTLEHHFRYTVPRDAEGGQIISLTAGAEDWAKNIGFAPLDLVVVPTGGF